MPLWVSIKRAQKLAKCIFAITYDTFKEKILLHGDFLRYLEPQSTPIQKFGQFSF